MSKNAERARLISAAIGFALGTIVISVNQNMGLGILVTGVIAAIFYYYAAREIVWLMKVYIRREYFDEVSGAIAPKYHGCIPMPPTKPPKESPKDDETDVKLTEVHINE